MKSQYQYFLLYQMDLFYTPPPNEELGINVLSLYRSPYILNEIYFCGENLNVLSLDGVDRITRTLSFIHDFV